MEAEIQPKRYFVIQVNCPYLVTNHNETFTVCSACVENGRYEFSGKSLQ